jgi:hypothetical protein
MLHATISHHAPKQMVTTATVVTDGATCGAGMVLYTKGDAFAASGYKRARPAVERVASTTAMPANLDDHRPLGVAIDTLPDMALAKANPLSAGSVSAVMGGAVTIMANPEALTIGDIALVEAPDAVTKYHDHKDYEPPKLLAVAGVGNGGAAPVASTAATFAAPAADAAPNTTPAVLAALGHGLGHEVVALGPSVSWTADGLTVDGTVRPLLSAAAVVKAHAEALAEPSTVAGHVAAATAAAHGSGTTPAVVASAISFAHARTVGEMAAIHGALGPAASELVAAVTDLMPAATPNAGASPDVLAAQAGIGAAAGPVAAEWAKLVPAHRRAPLDTATGFALPPPSSRNTAEAAYAAGLHDPEFRATVAARHPGAPDLMAALAADLADPAATADYILAHRAGMGTAKANKAALQRSGMSARDAKAATGHPRTREELVRKGDGPHWRRALQMGYVDADVASTAGLFASPFSDQWSTPDTGEWLSQPLGATATAETRVANGRHELRITGRVNLDAVAAGPTAPLGTGHIRSDFLHFVEQPGTYAFPVAPPAPTAIRFDSGPRMMLENSAAHGKEAGLQQDAKKFAEQAAATFDAAKLAMAKAADQKERKVTAVRRQVVEKEEAVTTAGADDAAKAAAERELAQANKALLEAITEITMTHLQPTSERDFCGLWVAGTLTAGLCWSNKIGADGSTQTDANGKPQRAKWIACSAADWRKNEPQDLKPGSVYTLGRVIETDPKTATVRLNVDIQPAAGTIPFRLYEPPIARYAHEDMDGPQALAPQQAVYIQVEATFEGRPLEAGTALYGFRLATTGALEATTKRGDTVARAWTAQQLVGALNTTHIPSRVFLGVVTDSVPPPVGSRTGRVAVAMAGSVSLRGDPRERGAKVGDLVALDPQRCGRVISVEKNRGPHVLLSSMTATDRWESIGGFHLLPSGKKDAVDELRA